MLFYEVALILLHLTMNPNDSLVLLFHLFSKPGRIFFCEEVHQCFVFLQKSLYSSTPDTSKKLLRGNKKFHIFFYYLFLCLITGRVFVLILRNSSGLQGFRDAEQACASRHARLASAEELHHAVAECFFSSCTRGWLHGGTVG